MKIKQMMRMLRARPPGWWVVCVSNIWCMHCGPCMCVAEANFSPVEFCPWEGGGTGLNPEVRQWTPKVPRFLHRARSFTSPHIMLINTLSTHCNYSCIQKETSPRKVMFTSVPMSLRQNWNLNSHLISFQRLLNSFCHAGGSQIVQVSEKLEGVYFFCVV